MIDDISALIIELGPELAMDEDSCEDGDFSISVSSTEVSLASGASDESGPENTFSVVQRNDNRRSSICI
jgi:hypothetical protein